MDRIKNCIDVIKYYIGLYIDVDIIIYYIDVNILNNWYYFTLFALLSYGIYQYFLDCAVINKKKSLTSSMAFYAIIGGNTFVITILTSLRIVYDIFFREQVVFGLLPTILLGCIQGSLFLFINMFRFESRKIFSQHYVLPIIKSSIIIVILFSWFVFGELVSATPASFVGFFLVGLSIYLFKDFGLNNNDEESKKYDKKSPEYMKGVIFLAMAVIVSAAIYLLAKYAVDPFNLNIFLFMLFANLFTCCIALYMIYSEKRQKSKKEKSQNSKEEKTHYNMNPEIIRCFKTGLWLGLINLCAYYCFLKSLSIGDASIIIPIYSLYVVVPVVLSTIIQGVELKEKVAVGVVISILAIIILRF